MVRKTNASENIDIDELNKQLDENREKQKPKRYLYGKGYITAKKVRFLHATMRFMLTNPHTFPVQTPEKGKKNFNKQLAM